MLMLFDMQRGKPALAISGSGTNSKSDKYSIKTLPPLIGWMRLPSLLWMVQTTGRDPKWVETRWNLFRDVFQIISGFRHSVAGKPVKALSRWTFAERGLWSISGGWNSAPNLQRWNRDNELRRWTTKTPQVLKQVGYGWIAAEKLLCNILQLLPSASICQHLLPAATSVHHTCYSALPCFSKQLCASQCPAVGAPVHTPAALPSSSAFLASWRLLLRDPLRKACQKQHTANKHSQDLVGSSR